MKDHEIHEAIAILREAVKAWEPALVDGMGKRDRNPYRVLIATILSLRTKDTVTAEVAPKLFALADNPYDMVSHSDKEIAGIIYPVGFYRNKARDILAISQKLIDEYDGQVPDDLDELLKLRGVGRKTANLVITAGFNKPGICVDIHVHRISNRWGYVQTKTPEQTEFALREKLPTQYWIEYNGLLVTFGQNLCTPTSPWCSRCPVEQFCDRVGVERSR
jgi:endonuclease-3